MHSELITTIPALNIWKACTWTRVIPGPLRQGEGARNGQNSVVHCGALRLRNLSPVDWLPRQMILGLLGSYMTP